MQMIPGVSTITFYEGKGEEQMKYFEDRLIEIVRLNPWLEGRIEKVGDRVHLLHKPFQGRLHPKTLALVRDSQLNEAMDYEEMTDRVSNLVVKPGNETLGQDEPLFRVTIIHISDTKYALFFSLSHVIADGHTYYSLYHMLSMTVSPQPLILAREHSFSQQLDQTMHGNDTYTWFFSPGMTINILLRLLGYPKTKVLRKDISKSWIAAQKTKHENTKTTGDSSVAFVSTNDILTSWYFTTFGCDVGVMAMNFRNRFTGLTDHHAGNYEALVAYQSDDFTAPAAIRQSLPLFHRKHKASQPLPSFWASTTTSVSVLSTWATFYTQIVLPHSNHLYHMPYFPNKDIAFHDITILYCPRQGELALLASTRTFATAEDIQFPQ